MQVNLNLNQKHEASGAQVSVSVTVPEVYDNYDLTELVEAVYSIERFFDSTVDGWEENQKLMEESEDKISDAQVAQVHLNWQIRSSPRGERKHLVRDTASGYLTTGCGLNVYSGWQRYDIMASSVDCINCKWSTEYSAYTIAINNPQS